MRARSHRFPRKDKEYEDTTYYDETDNCLDIGYQRLKKMSLKYPELSYITKLLADQNNLTHLPDPKYIPHLEQLCCSYNRLVEIPFYPYLTFLNISHNSISDLSSYHNSKLVYLDCSANPKLNITYDLPYCLQFYTSENQLDHLNISKIPRIQYLDCSHNNLESISYSNTLLELNIQYNRLRVLPSNPKLIHLTCDHNDIESIGSYNELLTLNVSHNGLSQIPSLPKLTDLMASHNRISILGFLPKVVLVDLSHNSLNHFNVPPNISYLSLQFNPIQDLHLDSDMMTHLKELQISFDLYSKLYHKYYDQFDFATVDLDKTKLNALSLKLNGVFGDKIINYINKKFDTIKFTDRDKIFPMIVQGIYQRYFGEQDTDSGEKFRILYEGIGKIYYKCLVATMYFNDYE